MNLPAIFLIDPTGRITLADLQNGDLAADVKKALARN
jgi:hypothetical protein